MKKYRCTRCDFIFEVEQTLNCFECPNCHKKFYVETNKEESSKIITNKKIEDIKITFATKNNKEDVIQTPVISKKNFKESELVKKSIKVTFKNN